MGKLRIAIVGLGIAGATLAAILTKRGRSVSIFEQTSEIREVGAGIALWPNSVRLLKRLGLEEDLERIGAVRTTSPIYSSSGTLLQELPTVSPVDGTTGYFAHRAELLATLAGIVPGDCVHLSKRCVSVRQNELEVEVSFADGSSESFDVLIAADGIHSTVLPEVAGNVPPPTYSGLAAYRGIVPNAARFGLTTGPLWTDNERYFVAFPMSGGKSVNFVGVVPMPGLPEESWLREGRKEMLRSEFAGWPSQVVSIIEAVNSTFLWGLYFREPLPKIVSGRVALMGDAAHPMLIHAGMGAGQGIEDAFALAVLLENIDPIQVSERLLIYQACRFERATAVQAMTRGNAMFLHRKAFGRADIPPPKGMGDTGWVIEHDAEAVARSALSAAGCA